MDVKLPQLGEGGESGTVVGILVKEGDTISKGQTILELESEKAVAPIPSSVAGKVTAIRVKEGEKISVGHVLITVAQGDGAGAKPSPGRAGGSVETSAATAPGAEKAPEDKTKEDHPEPEEAEAPDAEEPAQPALAPAAAPSIRKIARELGIDLARIRGSERGGRIVLADVRGYIQKLQKLASQPKTGTAAKAAAAPAEQIDFSKWGAITKKPVTPLRKVIMQRMTESWTTIPHVTQFDEADITGLMELRKKYAPAYQQNGAHLTLTSFVLKAVVVALKKHPSFNSSLDGAAEEIVFKDYYHIGLAVDTEQGLIVPVIRDVDKKNLLQISKEVSDLAEKARSRKVSLEELKGGTFTISNQGGIGGAQFTPIINKPEVAILGLGRGALKPAVNGDKIESRLLLPLGLSYDHRVNDGANAARFMVDLVAALESFPTDEIKL